MPDSNMHDRVRGSSARNRYRTGWPTAVLEIIFSHDDDEKGREYVVRT